MVLSGANAYSGGTTVLAGVLRIDNADSLPDGSSLTVGDGAGAAFGGNAGAAAGSGESVGVSAEAPLALVVPPLGGMGDIRIPPKGGTTSATEVTAPAKHAQTHDAALLSLNTRPAAEEGKAAAWWNVDNSPSERKHHPAASAVDAVMAMLESTT